MKKKPINKFDYLVNGLIQEFIKIPNFDWTQTDDVSNKLINIITYRLAEVSSYKELVCNHFIPATNKAIHESKVDFQKFEIQNFPKN